MKLCSACLLGIKVRYDGEDKINKEVVALLKKERIIPVCPEILGGLTVPREPAEANGDGPLVIECKAKVYTKSRIDVTIPFVNGAYEFLRVVDKYKVEEVILKQGSSSCGCGKIPDGTFSGRLIEGDGVTTALLKKFDIRILSEEDI